MKMAGHRLHEVSSKTIAEGHRQIEEFDQIAEFYEPQPQGAGERWCRATRFLRLSMRQVRRAEDRAADG